METLGFDDGKLEVTRVIKPMNYEASEELGEGERLYYVAYVCIQYARYSIQGSGKSVGLK